MSSNSQTLINRNEVVKYLRERCENFTEDEIYVTHKHRGGYELVFFHDGKLNREFFYATTQCLDLLIPRVRKFLNTGELGVYHVLPTIHEHALY